MSHLPNIFGAKIAQQLNNALGPLVFPLTLTKVVTSTDPADSTNEIKVETPYTGKGFKDVKSIRNAQGTLVRVNADVIVVLGASLPDNIEPLPGDKITIENKVHTIIKDGVLRDPAGAVFECQVS